MQKSFLLMLEYVKCWLSKILTLKRFFFCTSAFWTSTNNFSLRLTSLSITPVLLLCWHPNRKLTREAEKERLLPWLAPAKTNSLTSEYAVLLDWICLPARFCRSPTETKKEKEREIWKGRLGSLALPDAHLPPWRDKRQNQRVQGSKIIPSILFTSSLFTLLFTCMADAVYRQELQS